VLSLYCIQVVEHLMLCIGAAENRLLQQRQQTDNATRTVDPLGCWLYC
jgi:hypothetical protein